MIMPVDVTFHPEWWHKNTGVCFNREFFFDMNYRIEADICMRKALYEKFGDLGLGEKKPEPRPMLGSDLIASGFLHSQILGCEVRYSDSNPPEVLCRNMSDEEVERLEVPELVSVEAWRGIERQASELQKLYGRVENCINLMGIQNIALDLRGSELFIDYHENPERAHHLLKVCTDLSLEIGKLFKKMSHSVSAGVTAIVRQTIPEVYLTSNCSVEMVSRETYEEFLLPYDQKLAEELQPFGIHHCGKTMEHVVDGYAKVRHLKFAEVGAFSDMEIVRKALPGIFLNARYSPVRLKDACYEEMRGEIKEILEMGHPLELLSISCVGIDGSTPDDRVREFFHACRDARIDML